MNDTTAPSSGRTCTGPERLENISGRPFIMFFREPMLFVAMIYVSFIYHDGCVYLLFAAYPIVFTQGHHLNVG
ncbi:unnamed protein product, partial [Rhizoctonia solani]